jgi:hypothetical protein
MFFVFGVTSRHKTVDSGRFRCPNEDRTTPFRHEEARRWFTLFFIPLIPLGRQGEWVRCQSCGATYGPDVLDRHPTHP